MVPDWLRSRELPAQFPIRPPTSSLALMCFVFTLNAKHPEQKLAPNAAPTLHNYTRVIFVIVETPAEANLAPNFKIQTKQWRWFVCVCVCCSICHYFWGVRDTFKLMLIFKLMFFICRFCGEALKNLYSVCPWDVYIRLCHEITRGLAGAPLVLCFTLVFKTSFFFICSYLMNMFAQVQKNKEIHAESVQSKSSGPSVRGKLIKIPTI